MQHQQPVDRGDQRMHDVLDPDDRHAAATDLLDQRDQRRAFVLGEAAGDLVEQEQARPGRERAGELQPLAVEQASAHRPDGWPSGRARIARARRRSGRRCRARCGRRRTRPPPPRSRTPSCRRTAAEFGRSAPCRAGSGVRVASRVMSAPAKMTRPASGATVPVAIPNSVVLPAPFGPMMPSASPSSSARSIALATTTAPKRLEIFSSARIVVMGVGWAKSPAVRIPVGTARTRRAFASPATGDPRYDNSCSCPPTGICGAGLLVVMTSSNLSPLRCHWPATSGVLVTFLTGWPVHFTGPTIDW